MEETLSQVTLKPGEHIIDGKLCQLIGTSYWDVANGDFVAEAVEPEFKIDSIESCNWVLKKFQRAEAEKDAILNTPEVLEAKAIVAQAEKLVKQYDQRLKWLDVRFSAELGEFAKTQFKGTRKTFDTIFGSISLRTKTASVKVADTAKAIAWAKKWLPKEIKPLAVVKTVEEKFFISAVPKGIIEEIQCGYERRLAGESCRELAKYDKSLDGVFDFTPACETVTVKTGVGNAD